MSAGDSVSSGSPQELVTSCATLSSYHPGQVVSQSVSKQLAEA